MSKGSALEAKSSAQQDFEDDLRGPVKVGTLPWTACQPDLRLLLSEQTAARALETWFHHEARVGDGRQQRRLKFLSFSTHQIEGRNGPIQRHSKRGIPKQHKDELRVGGAVRIKSFQLKREVRGGSFGKTLPQREHFLLNFHQHV